MNIRLIRVPSNNPCSPTQTRISTLETKYSAVAESRLEAAVTRIFKPPEGGTHNAEIRIASILVFIFAFLLISSA